MAGSMEARRRAAEEEHVAEGARADEEDVQG
jgi:hypothetical protein